MLELVKRVGERNRRTCGVMMEAIAVDMVPLNAWFKSMSLPVMITEDSKNVLTQVEQALSKTPAAIVFELVTLPFPDMVSVLPVIEKVLRMAVMLLVICITEVCEEPETPVLIMLKTLFERLIVDPLIDSAPLNQRIIANAFDCWTIGENVFPATTIFESVSDTSKLNHRK